MEAQSSFKSLGFSPLLNKAVKKKPETSQIPCFPLTFQPNQEHIQQSNPARQKHLTAFTPLLHGSGQEGTFSNKARDSSKTEFATYHCSDY